MGQKRALITAAHADDETLGCGGTIARLVQQGWSIDLMSFTGGGRDEPRFAKQASDQLQIRYLAAHMMPDNAMDNLALITVVRWIEAQAVAPYDLIFTHWPDCLNVDHGIVARATLTAFRPQNGHPHKILGYYVPSSSEWYAGKTFAGNVYYGLTSEQADKKIQVLQDCYASEMRDPPHPRSYANVQLLMRVWGAEVGLKWAEKFQLLREVL